MFESDDFDQILSQFDFPELTKNNSSDPEDKSPNIDTPITLLSPVLMLSTTAAKNGIECDLAQPALTTNDSALDTNVITPKHTKRRIINSYFDHKNKRKFPGPAGILNGTLQEPNDESVCHMELLSQDIDFSENHLRRSMFDSPLWHRILGDIKNWNMPNEDSIKSIKQHALVGRLRKRKAQTVVAFIETVDRSVTDPLVTLRDSTGSIKCTLHRDAWSTFSPYLVSEYCALVLWKPTILTTGSAFKKHYLNITLSNIYAIYSSAVLKDEESKTMPEGYRIVCEDDCTVIKAESSVNLDTNNASNIGFLGTDDVYDELDSIFSDDVF